MMMTSLLTETPTAAVFSYESVTVIVHFPPPTGVTVNVALGPLPELGLTVATAVLELVAVSEPV